MDSKKELNFVNDDLKYEQGKDTSNKGSRFTLRNILFGVVFLVLGAGIIFYVRRGNNDATNKRTDEQSLMNESEREINIIEVEDDSKDFLLYLEKKVSSFFGFANRVQLMKLNMKTFEKVSVSEEISSKYPNHHINALNPKVSPDGKTIAFVEPKKLTNTSEFPKTIMLYNGETLIQIEIISSSINFVPKITSEFSYCFTQNGEGIIYNSNDQIIEKLNNSTRSLFHGNVNNLIMDHENGNLIFNEICKTGDKHHNTIKMMKCNQTEPIIIQNRLLFDDVIPIKLSYKHKLLFVSSGRKNCSIVNNMSDELNHPIKSFSLIGYEAIMNVEVSKDGKSLYVIAKIEESSTKSSLVVVNNFDFDSLNQINELIGEKVENFELEIIDIAVM